MATEVVGIKIQLKDDESALNSLKTIESTLKRISQIWKIQINFVADVPKGRELVSILTRLAELKTELTGRKSAVKVSGLGTIAKDATKAMQTLNRTDEKLKQVSKDEDAIRAKSNFRFSASGLNEIGNALRNVGNTLSRLGNNPLSNMVKTAGYTLTSQITSTATGGISKIGSRYDILKTYPMLMADMSTSSYTAQQSIKDLEKSVLGLPTGLDEVADMAKRFSLALGDMKKGTKTAIAANNAFLASASTETQRYQGMMQINDILTGKELQPREWMSLAASMPRAISEIGKELGYKKNSAFLEQLYAGKIGAEEFQKALIKVGTEEGKIAKMASISKVTLEGIASNVSNRIARAGANILDALDDVLLKTTGQDLVQNLNSVLEALSKLGTMAGDWIRNHPETIMDWFNRLKNYDWKGLGNGMLFMARQFGEFIKLLMKIPASVTGIALAGGLNVIGGFLNGMGSLVSAAGRFSKGIGFLGKGSKATEAVTTASKGTQIFTKGLKTVFSGAAAIAAYAGDLILLAEAMKKIGDFKISWSTLLNNLGQMATAVVAIGGVGTAIGALLTAGGGVGGIAAAVGAGALGVIELLAEGLAHNMTSLAKAFNDMSSARIPNRVKIGQMATAIKEMVKLSGSGSVRAHKIKSYAYAAKQFAEIGKQLSTITATKLPSDGQVEAVKNAIDNVAEIFNTDDESWSESVIKASKAKQGSKEQGFITDMMKAVGDTLNYVIKISDKIKEFNSKYPSNDEIDKFKTNIGGIRTIVNAVQRAIEPLFSGTGVIDPNTAMTKGSNVGKGKQAVDTKDIEKFGKLLETLTGAFGKLDGFVNSLSVLKDLREKVWKALGTDKNTRDHGALTDGTIYNEVSGLVLFIKKLIDTDGGNLGSLVDVAKTFNKFDITTLTDTFNSLPSLLEALGTVRKAFSGDNAKFFGNAVTGEYNEDYSKFYQNLNGVFRVIKDIKKNLKGVSTEDLSADVTNVSSAIETLKGVPGKLAAIKTSIIENNLMKGTGLITVVKQVKKAVRGSESISADAGQFASACEMMQGAIETILGGKSDGINGFLDALGKIPNAMTKATNAISKAKTWGQSFADGFNNKVNSIVTAISSLPGRLVTIEGFYGAGNRLGTQFTNGYNDALRGMQSTNGASNAINSAANAVQRGINGIVNSITASTGGLIGNGVLYRADGGPTPRGTDTVHAMLTPGEYVHNDSAVKYFGTDFMSKINSMDVDGALDELMRRTSRGLIAPIGIKIDRSNTTNHTNNAKLTQNIYTNNSNYGYVRANRYMRSLM